MRSAQQYATPQTTRSALRLALAIAVPVVLAFVVIAAAKEPPKDPMFIRWLKADDPGDQTIHAYWQRVNAGKATPEDMVDLGSMLYLRGYPKDAIRMFHRALDQDKKLYEAWFRIGLVEHREGNLHAARRAYRKCLKELTGHGWCNFYMGLLQEQMGKPSRALDYYRRAFKFAPALADPKVNPELLYSRLQLGAVLRHNYRERFTTNMPMGYLRPERVAAVAARFAETPEGSESGAVHKGEAAEPNGQVATPAPTPTPGPKLVPTPGLRPTPDTSSVVDRQRRRSPIRLDPAATPKVGSDEPAPPPPPPRRILRRKPEEAGAGEPTSAPAPVESPVADASSSESPGSSSSTSSSTPSSTGYPPHVGSASSEAHLLPWWRGRLERMAFELAGPDAVPYQVPSFPPATRAVTSASTS